jgi:hypothetical protein
MTLSFTDDNTLYAGGFDFSPAKFVKSGANWASQGLMEKEEESKGPAATSVAARASVFQSAKSKFSAVDKSYSLNTKHKNTINSMRVRNGKITTTDISGQVVVWTDS